MTVPLTDEVVKELARIHHPCFEMMLKNWRPLIAKVESLKEEVIFLESKNILLFAVIEKLKIENAK